MKVQKSTFDFKDQQILTIKSEAKEEETQHGLKLKVIVSDENGIEKSIILNNTSKDNLIDAYGEDTADWIMKDVRVHILKNQKVGKEFKDVMYLTAPNKDLQGREVNL